MKIEGIESLHHGRTIELVEAKKRALSRWHETVQMYRTVNNM